VSRLGRENAGRKTGKKLIMHRYIDTPLLDNLQKGKLTQVFDFALAEDAVNAVLKIATDKSINGMLLICFLNPWPLTC
jgi:hypothetical protein